MQSKTLFENKHNHLKGKEKIDWPRTSGQRSDMAVSGLDFLFSPVFLSLDSEESTDADQEKNHYRNGCRESENLCIGKRGCLTRRRLERNEHLSVVIPPLMYLISKIMSTVVQSETIE